MKRVTILMAVVIIVLSQACAHTNSQVPAKVKAAFNQKFPDAKKVKWDKENANEWEAEFKMNGKEYSANFTSNGTWKETEYEIKKSDIPAAVKQTLDNDFAGFDIEEAEISVTPGGKVFEFALEKDEVDMEVAISSNGKLLKKESKKEDKDGEGDEENEEGDEDNN